MTKFISDDEIRNRVAYHPPAHPEIVAAHEDIRNQYGDLAISMNALLPEGPLKTRAVNAILDAMHLANHCVAVTQDLHRDEQIVSECVRCGEMTVLDPAPGSKYRHVHTAVGEEEPHAPVMPS